MTNLKPCLKRSQIDWKIFTRIKYLQYHLLCLIIYHDQPINSHKMACIITSREMTLWALWTTYPHKKTLHRRNLNQRLL